MMAASVALLVPLLLPLAMAERAIKQVNSGYHRLRTFTYVDAMRE